MKIIVASMNPVKLEATKAGFEQMFQDKAFTIEGVKVPSGVSDQPMTDAETLKGALNRSIAAQNAFPEADFWVGIEGGIGEKEDQMEAFAWISIISTNQQGKARTASFFLPPEVCKLVREGYELGDADDKVFGTANSKQQNGAVGLLTGNVMTRKELYVPAVTLALIPFVRQDLYPA